MNLTARTVLTVLLALCLVPAAEAATRRPHGDEDDNTARAKIHLESGVAYFNEGRFDDAEREMTRAYGLRPVPELKYNLGQCQERIGAFDRAVASYREYLKGRPQAQDRAAVEKRITLLEEQLRSQPPKVAADEPAPGPAAVQPPPVAAPAALTVDQPPPEKVVFKEIVVYKAPPPKAGRTARTFGYALLGLTAVGLASGLAFTLTAGNIGKDIDDSSGMFQMTFGVDPKGCNNRMSIGDAVKAKIGGMPQNPSLIMNITDGFCSFYDVSNDAQRLNGGASIIGYGIAGLSAIGAGITFIYARHQDKKQALELARKRPLPNLSMVPSFGPGGGGMLIAGEF